MLLFFLHFLSSNSYGAPNFFLLLQFHAFFYFDLNGICLPKSGALLKDVNFWGVWRTNLSSFSFCRYLSTQICCTWLSVCLFRICPTVSVFLMSVCFVVLLFFVSFCMFFPILFSMSSFVSL